MNARDDIEKGYVGGNISQLGIVHVSKRAADITGVGDVIGQDPGSRRCLDWKHTAGVSQGSVGGHLGLLLLALED